MDMCGVQSLCGYNTSYFFYQTLPHQKIRFQLHHVVGDWHVPYCTQDDFHTWYSLHLTSNCYTHTLGLKWGRFGSALTFRYLLLQVNPPFSTCVYVFVCVWVHVCVHVTLSCEAESQADSSPCWQRSTAGRLITAHTRTDRCQPTAYQSVTPDAVCIYMCVCLYIWEHLPVSVYVHA